MTNETPGGYNGQILRVNLTNRFVSTETLDARLCRKYLGGAGFVSHFLWDELQAGADALGPENKLIFALGPATGMPLPGSGRHCVGAKSPLAGGIAKSEAGEFWGAELKRAGHDALIVEGQSEKPVYISILDGEASIRDAGHLWGSNTREAQNAIRSELGSDVRVALIGPGGENLVRYACIMHGLYDAAGRGGLGAVMGSKRLKAIAVKGHRTPPMAHPDRIADTRRWLAGNMHLVGEFQEFGTGARMDRMEKSGNLPVRNFRDGVFPGVSRISAEAIKDSIRIGMEGCFACPVRCKKKVRIKGAHPVDPAYGGPEYETLAALGSNCGIDNLEAIARGNQLCNAYSLDTISTGSVIAFAMECFETGLLTTADTDGIDLRFGNDKALLQVIELIARREGIGELLAEGTARAARHIGRGAIDIAMQVKGLEAGMHEPRIKPGLGLGFMVNPHGADHCTNIHDNAFTKERNLHGLRPLGILEPVPADDIGPRKVHLFRLMQLQMIVRDSLALCLFLPYSPEQIAEITAAVTGWDTGVTEQLATAERTLTLARMFDLREGFTARDDRLPRRFFEPKTDGALADKALDPEKLERAKVHYYTLMGWDPQTGVPTREKLEELGIP